VCVHVPTYASKSNDTLRVWERVCVGAYGVCQRACMCVRERVCVCVYV